MPCSTNTAFSFAALSASKVFRADWRRVFYSPVSRLSETAVILGRYSQLDPHVATDRIGDEAIAVRTFVHFFEFFAGNLVPGFELDHRVQHDLPDPGTAIPGFAQRGNSVKKSAGSFRPLSRHSLSAGSSIPRG